MKASDTLIRYNKGTELNFFFLFFSVDSLKKILFNLSVCVVFKFIGQLSVKGSG